MDQIEKDLDPQCFTKDVETAIDKLFNASRRIEIDPLTNKPKELPQNETDQELSFQIIGQEEEHPEEIKPLDIKTLEPHGEAKNSTTDENFWELDSGLELDEEENEAVNLEQLISQLDQMLLTLDWEVTRTNLESATDLLKTIQKSLETNPDNNFQELFDLMARVFEGMKEHPEEVPVSGPKVLQKGLNTLRLLMEDKIQNQEDREELLRETRGELESAIPKEGLDTSHEARQDVALEDSTEESDGRELEFEDTLQEQPVLTEPGPSEYDLLVSAIRSHIKALDKCIGQILPVEDLLARTPRMEKLYHFQQKIKNRLKYQKRFLTRALAGDYSLSADVSDIPQEPENISPGIDQKGREFLPRSIPCPWQKLVTARWAGRPVAFVPEEVAFVGRVAWWARKGLKEAKKIQLKKLRAWPWSRLQPLMQGELSNQEEIQLQRLEFPVVQNPDPSPDYSQSPGNPIVLVLYRRDEGRFLILDTQLEPILLIPESSWEASVGGKEPWAGRLKMENKSVSVLTLESVTSQ